MSDKVQTGVYRHPSGHTIIINSKHPEDQPVPDGYERLGSEEEFETGRFHPYAMPGKEPAGWTPESAGPGGADVLAPPTRLVLDDLPDEAKADIVKQVAAELGDVVTKKDAETATQKAVAAAVKQANAEADKKVKALEETIGESIEAAVAKAVEAATK